MQNEAYDYMSNLLQWRKTSEAARRGAMKHFSPNNGLYLYKRYTDDAAEQVVVAMNGTDSPIEVDMSRYAETIVPGSKWRNVLTGEVITLVPENGAKVTFPAHAAFVLAPAE